MINEELLKGLSEEQLEKARACKTHAELLELAKEEGLQLTDEQLESVNGGACRIEAPSVPCPNCNGTRIEATWDAYADNSNGVHHCVCLDCGERFDA